MSKKSKMSRTPSRTPRAKTPTIKNIDVAATAETTVNAVVNAIPVIAVDEKQIIPLVVDMDYRRIFLMVIAFVIFIICLVFFWYNAGDQKILAVAEFGSKVPSVMFNGWFVVLFLIASLLGFAFIVRNTQHLNFAFFMCAILYLVSFVFVFTYLYMSIKLYSATVQIFSFILFVTSVLLILQVVMQGTKYPLFSIIAILPSVIFSGFALYTGGVLNPRVNF